MVGRFSYLTTQKVGCFLWDDCFTCPYPDCIDSQKGKTMLARAKAQELQGQGCKVPEIAQKMNKSERQVRRYLDPLDIRA